MKRKSKRELGKEKRERKVESNEEKKEMESKRKERKRKKKTKDIEIISIYYSLRSTKIFAIVAK